MHRTRRTSSETGATGKGSKKEGRRGLVDDIRHSTTTIQAGRRGSLGYVYHLRKVGEGAEKKQDTRQEPDRTGRKPEGGGGRKVRMRCQDKRKLREGKNEPVRGFRHRCSKTSFLMAGRASTREEQRTARGEQDREEFAMGGNEDDSTTEKGGNGLRENG